MSKKPFVGPLKLELVVVKMGLTKLKAWKWFVLNGSSVWQELKLELCSCKDGIKVNYKSYSNGGVNF